MQEKARFEAAFRSRPRPDDAFENKAVIVNDHSQNSMQE